MVSSGCQCRLGELGYWVMNTYRHSVTARDVKIVFFWYSILGTKNSIFFDYRLSADVGNWFRQAASTDDESGCASSTRWQPDVSLVVPSAPRPRDPLQLRLQQQWCIPPPATVWRIQALARRTVARGIVDQWLLRRRTGAHQWRRDDGDIKRHPAAVCLLHSRSQITANYYHTRYRRRHANG